MSLDRLALAIGLAALFAGCTQEMGKQGRLRTFDQARLPPEGTVPRDGFGEAPRPAVTLALLKRGRQRFEIYCAACHGFGGDSDGIVVQRGFLPPPSYHTTRLRAAPDSHFYDVITKGSGAMYSYADRVAVADRWAIVAYIRALQLSRNAHVRRLEE